MDAGKKKKRAPFYLQIGKRRSDGYILEFSVIVVLNSKIVGF
jgi:hypothetical protein